MAECRISSKELAALSGMHLTGMHPTSLSKIKNCLCLARIDEKTLNALCKALKCQSGGLGVYEEDKPEA